MDFDLCHYNLTNEDAKLQQSGSGSSMEARRSDASPAELEYRATLQEQLFEGSSRRVLNFRDEDSPHSGNESRGSPLKVLQAAVESPHRRRRCLRKIPGKSCRILDAPGFVNDYYSNLLDWSKKDVMAVALGSFPILFLFHVHSILTCRFVFCQFKSTTLYRSTGLLLVWTD